MINPQTPFKNTNTRIYSYKHSIRKVIKNTNQFYTYYKGLFITNYLCNIQVCGNESKCGACSDSNYFVYF